MSDFRLQRFRGGWAVAEYRDGIRVSRRGLKASDRGAAAVEFASVVNEASRPVAPTVADLWSLYRADRKGRTIAANMEWSGRAILPRFGPLQPDDITAAVCRAHRKARREVGIKDGTILTELGHLRVTLKWAEKTRLIERAPHIEMPSKPPARDVHLTRDEVERLIAAASMPHVALFITLAISTAGRREALLTLTWDRVDFARGLIFLGSPDRQRSLKGRATVPMTDTLREALATARDSALTDHVIEWAGRPVKSVRTGLGEAARRAGVSGVSPHVFRHSAAVWMAQDGASMKEIADYLGHTNTSITEAVYARYMPDRLRKAAASLELNRRL
jgi:integrase